jgi:hypothetical protein
MRNRVTRGTWVRRSLAVSVVCLAATVFVSQAEALGSKLGVNFDCQHLESSALSVYPSIQSTHSQWVRIAVDWGAFETGNGVYNISYINQTLTPCFEFAHDHGLNVLVVFGPHTPGWANGNQAGNVPPTDPETYAAAVGHLTSLYPGSNNVDGIQAIEIWNEADVNANWAGTTAQYATLLTDAYLAVVDFADTTVVTSGTSGFDYSWVNSVLSHGPALDALGVHPYPHDPATYWDNPAHYLNDGTNNSLAGMVAALNDNHYASWPIWFTEAGFVSGEPPISQSEQAQGLTAFYQYIRHSCTGCSQVQETNWFTSWEPAGNADVPYDLLAPNFSLNVVGQAMAALP